jgi:putative glutamine amidotransferase
MGTPRESAGPRLRPIVGVTTSNRGGWRNFLFQRLAMRRAGGKALRLRPGDAVALEELDALVIGGGDDIGAELYGGEVAPNVRFDPDRDIFELALLKKALPTSLPILGVCRGAQMINVALGGTLHGDIYTVFAEAKRLRTVLPRKDVWIEPESRLGQILLCNPCRVNALHHQAVDRVGRGLRAVGRDDNGIVQAIEGIGARFLLGVQWHPEFLVHLRAQQRIFTALVACARECPVQEFAT